VDAYTAVLTKRDTRAYSNRPIPDETLRRILQAGRMAGSSKNSQPCRFIVLRDPAHRQEVATCGQWAVPIAAAPLAIAIVLLPGGGAFDAGRAAQNMMITAWAEGITSCPVALHDQNCARERLGLPEGYHVQTVIAFGYPDESAPPRESRPRLPFEEYVRYEYWQG
jgi:nitroreductase